MGRGNSFGNPFTLTSEADEPTPAAGSFAYDTEDVLVRVSHYWPPKGGVNCARFVDGVCLSHLASGERWEDWVDRAIACPVEWDFGTRLLISGREWVCLDRGGAIVIDDGIAWVDMLTPKALYPYGEVVSARVEVR